jgi:FkbH-like protein
VKIKLIIWDLDETLWTGILAEGEDVSLNTPRVNLLKELGRHGIVSSICSKNDYETAKHKLIEFGLWDHLVFCRIEFAPKGPSVKSIIQDMQLRAENVLFVDDSPLNLNEVLNANPGINILDARTADCDAALGQLLVDNLDSEKSRTEEYRMLESRLSHERSSPLSREEFLHTCDIRVCLISRADNIEFSDRLEELINRTNQLNFRKTRVDPGSMPDYLSRVLDVECYSVAVWDNYGYYGIVGFAAVEQWEILRHFAFSCRIMHMGVEQWVLAKLVKRYPDLAISDLSVVPSTAPWLHEIAYAGDIRDEVRSNEDKRPRDPAQLRIMASCQSGAIAHYSKLGPIAEFDNAPRQFELCQILTKTHVAQNYPPNLVYGAYTDYANPYWPVPLTFETYKTCVEEFCRFIFSGDRKMLVILPPENLPDDFYRPDYGMTRDRVVAFNEIWGQLGYKYPNLSLLCIDSLALSDEVIDCRHYEVSLLRKLGERVAVWMNAPADMVPRHITQVIAGEII